MKKYLPTNLIKNKIIQYAINLFVLLIAWGGLFRYSFSCDTLAHQINPEESIGTWLLNGRYLAYLINQLLFKMGILATDYYFLFFITALLILALAFSIIQEIFNEFFPVSAERPFESICFLLTTHLIFINVFFGEHLMFTECLLGFSLTYLLAGIGTYLLLKGRWVWAFLWLLCSTMFFQMGTIVSAIITATYLLIQCRGKITKKVLLKGSLSLGLILGTGFLNMSSSYLLQKLGLIERVQKGIGYINVSDKIAELSQALLQIGKNSLSLLPNVGIPLIMGLIPIICLVFQFAKRREWKKLGAVIAAEILFLLLVFLIPFVQSSTYFPPRIIFTYYVMQSATYLLALAFLEGKLKLIAGWCCCFYLVIQIIFSNVIVANHYVSNTLDMTYARLVYEEILEYEAETGNRITKIATVNDTNCSNTYDLVYYKRDQINERALGTTTYSILQFVTKEERTFTKTEMSESIYQNYFEGKNWDYFKPDEQLVFENDTLFWVVF